MSRTGDSQPDPQHMTPQTIIRGTSKTRPAKPGTVRCGIVLSQEHHDALAAEALAADPVYTRPVNEFLSIKLEKQFKAGQGQQ